MHNKTEKRRCFITLCAALLASCGSGADDTSNRAGTVVPLPDASYLLGPTGARNWLTSAELTSSQFPENSAFHNAWFMPIGSSGAAQHVFSGTLHVNNRALAGNGPDTLDGRQLKLLPGVPLQFISHDGYLVPLQREPQFANDSSYWGIMLSPGRVWHEGDDGTWSRASFPFVLVHRTRNEVHNGIATFLFDGVSVSQLRLQVVQETAAWARYDLWAHVPMTYTVEQFANDTALRDAFDAELAMRLPVASWADLEQLHGALLQGFEAGVVQTDISVSGIVRDGTIYLRGCRSRYGDFPYCREMRHGAFSVTKSSIAALTLLRLAQKYGPSVLDERIDSYLNITASHSGWNDVTFRDALSMTTGIGDREPVVSGDVFADENQPKMEQFAQQLTAAAKLQVAFSYGDFPWPPGTIVRYNSTHTFVLGAAMQAFLQSREGPAATLSGLLRDEVFAAIGLQNVPFMTTFEPGNVQGLPLMFVGFYPTVDELGRVAMLLQQLGEWQGEQVLHRELTATALYRRAENGLPADFLSNVNGMSRYLLSFWSSPEVEASGCGVEVPVMSGFGGNSVALLPNGVTAFRFADAHNYDPGPLISVGRQLGALCAP
jgi:CubicO group peptidase (beta-lactamase class C family)